LRFVINEQHVDATVLRHTTTSNADSASRTTQNVEPCGVTIG
jgi:hypothetical protein